MPFLDQIPQSTRTTIAQIIISIALLIILWLLRHLFANIIVRPLRQRVKETDNQYDDMIMGAADNFISYILMAFAVLVASRFITGLQEVLRLVAASLALLAVFRLVYDLGSAVLQSEERIESVLNVNVDPSLVPASRVVFRILVIVVGLVAVASLWNINLAGLLAGVGLIGLAVSLAAKSLLDDFLAFAIIIADDLYVVGEYIISPNAEGVVERIRWRSTRVRQLNQGLVTAPNSDMVNDWVVNWSRLEQRWFNFMLGLTYTATADQMDTLSGRIREMLENRDAVQSDSVVVYFTEYDDSSLNILIRCYINIADWTKAKEERHYVNLELMRIVENMGMDIAFPSRSIYLEEVPDGMSANGATGTGEKPKQQEHVKAQAGGNYPKSFSDSDPNPDSSSEQYDDSDGEE